MKQYHYPLRYIWVLLVCQAYLSKPSPISTDISNSKKAELYILHRQYLRRGVDHSVPYSRGRRNLPGRAWGTLGDKRLMTLVTEGDDTRRSKKCSIKLKGVSSGLRNRTSPWNSDINCYTMFGWFRALLVHTKLFAWARLCLSHHFHNGASNYPQGFSTHRQR